MMSEEKQTGAPITYSMAEIRDALEQYARRDQAKALTESYAEKAALYDALVTRLHETERHPDYEYGAREYPRKFGGDVCPPEGFGWVENTYRDGGMTRYDNTEDYFFMRLKSDAKKDPISPFSLPPIKMEPVSHDDVLHMVFPDGITLSDRSFIIATPLLHVQHDKDLDGMKNSFFRISVNLNRECRLNMQDIDALQADATAALIDVGRIRLMIRLSDKTTFIKAANDAGHWGSWTSWSGDYLKINIDRLVLLAAVAELYRNYTPTTQVGIPQPLQGKL